MSVGASGGPAPGWQDQSAPHARGTGTARRTGRGRHAAPPGGAAVPWYFSGWTAAVLAVVALALVAQVVVGSSRAGAPPARPAVTAGDPGGTVPAGSGGTVPAGSGGSTAPGAAAHPAGASGGQPLDPTLFATGSCEAFGPLVGDRHRTVFIDAGHGGPDPGAVGTTSSGQSVHEADETLPVALATVSLLRDQGYRVAVSAHR